MNIQTSILRERSPVARFLSGLHCFVTLQLMNIKSVLAYAVNTWIETLLFVCQQLTGLLFLWVVFTKVHAVGGWTLAEMVFLYGLLILSMALYRLVFQGVRDTGMLIMRGGLDQLLTRPRSVLLLMSCRRSNPTGAMDLITGLALVILAGLRMDYAWTVAKAAWLALFVLSGNVIMVAVMMAQAATCFWLVRFTVLHEMIMALRQFCYYPMKIYGLFIRALLYSIIPLAFASYLPAATLLGKDDFSSAWLLSPPLAAVLSLTLAISFFNLGRRFYESTGS